MTKSFNTNKNPVLLGMLLLVMFVIVIASIAYTVKYYINEFNKPKITTTQRVKLWISVTSIIIVWAGLIYLGIKYNIFRKGYALVTGDVQYN